MSLVGAIEVDEDNNVKTKGPISLRTAKNLGFMYAVSHSYVQLKNGKILLQLRKDKNKPKDPAKLCPSIVASVRHEENPADAIHRKSEKQLGITINSKNVDFLFARPEKKVNLYYNTFVAKENKNLKSFEPKDDLVEGIYEISLKNLENLFLGRVESVKIEGFVLDQNKDRIPDKKDVNLDDFYYHPIACYLEAFKKIEFSNAKTSKLLLDARQK